jgi:hypothetical protein
LNREFMNMLNLLPAGAAPVRAASARGYRPVYRQHQVNHCPGCGRSHWLVGRLLAECGFCATALPLDRSNRPGSDWDEAAAA